MLTATANGSVATGTYSFTVLETAQSEQMLSSGFKSSSSTVGNGTVTLRFGDGVDNSVDVADLNGGEGITAGTFRITDRSGASAIIDVSGAQTIDDVLSAINNCGSINVTASTEDGHIVLTDNTGETSSNLKVQEIGKGTTAESLGLSGINVASSTADGSDIYYVTKDTALEYLNDGNGVALSTVLPDITYTLKDGSSGTIDFSNASPSTLGDVIDVINSSSSGLLSASLSSDGARLIVTDSSSGNGTFSLSSTYGTAALHNLGLDVASANGTITGNALVGGLDTVLLSSLNGGQGLGTMGTINVTNSANTTTSVDLSDCETLEDVIDTINSANAGVTAAVNDSRDGIVVTDTTGGVNSLVISDGDSNENRHSAWPGRHPFRRRRRQRRLAPPDHQCEHHPEQLQRRRGCRVRFDRRHQQHG